jgi:hypothetical protein
VSVLGVAKVVTSAVSLIWVGFVFGAVVSKILHFGREDIIAIAIETGIQNMGVAILFLYFSLPQLDADMTLGTFSNKYFLLSFLLSLIFDITFFFFMGE